MERQRFIGNIWRWCASRVLVHASGITNRACRTKCSQICKMLMYHRQCTVHTFYVCFGRIYHCLFLYNQQLFSFVYQMKAQHADSCCIVVQCGGVANDATLPLKKKFMLINISVGRNLTQNVEHKSKNSYAICEAECFVCVFFFGFVIHPPRSGSTR